MKMTAVTHDRQATKQIPWRISGIVGPPIGLLVSGSTAHAMLEDTIMTRKFVKKSDHIFGEPEIARFWVFNRDRDPQANQQVNQESSHSVWLVGRGYPFCIHPLEAGQAIRLGFGP